MEELGVGRFYHPETQAEFHVVEWGERGAIKNLDENRLTRSGLAQSQVTTFAILYPNGDVKHRTFSGVLPEDLDDLVDYWGDHESL